MLLRLPTQDGERPSEIDRPNPSSASALVVNRIATTLVFASIMLVASCGEEKEALGTYTEACGIDADCKEELSCLLGLCTIRCDVTKAGACLELHAMSICAGGTCYQSCRDSSNCPNDLGCTMMPLVDPTCRP